MQKKIIIWQSYICQFGGVETALYNFCINLWKYYDILVLIEDGDREQIKRLRQYVRVERIDRNKKYECDCFIRNSVWGNLPTNINASGKMNYKYPEMQHTDYVKLQELGTLEGQYVRDDRVDIHIGCGKFVAEQYKKLTGKECIPMQNILAPKKETEKVYRFITCARLTNEKGWDRMLKMMQMMKEANIKFTWDIFTPNPKNCSYEEVKFWKPRFDIFDYVANADFCVLLSTYEGMPYTILEALQYKTPCIVTEVEGMKELIQDGVNGYVVPFDMNFDINKIKKIPKLNEFKGTTAQDWCNLLGGAEYIEKKEMEEMRVKVKALKVWDGNLQDAERGVFPKEGDVWITSIERAEYLEKRKAVEILEGDKEEKPVEKVTKKKAVNKKKNK